MTSKIKKHLKGDIETYKHEAKEDKDLMRDIDAHYQSRPSYQKGKKSKSKVEKVMKEFKSGKLHSGSKKGPKVKNPKQAIAIALSEARRAKKNK
jgi:hypothetical protein